MINEIKYENITNIPLKKTIKIIKINSEFIEHIVNIIKDI